MKIAVDVTPILPGGEGGGAKQLVIELLKGLGRHQGNEHYILLTSDKNHDVFAEFESLGMKRLCVRALEINSLTSFWQRAFNKIKREIKGRILPGILKNQGIALLFCPMTAPTYSEAGIPTISILYDLQHMFYPTFFNQEELANRNNFYKKLKQKVDYIICISSFTRDTVIEKLGISAEKVTSVPISIHNRFNIYGIEALSRVLSKYNLSGRKYALYPANFWPHKNHKMLLTAFNMYLNKYPDQKLDLVFSGATVGDDLKILEDAVMQMNISERIHFLGYLPEEELASIWAGAHFLVFPSLFEGFGIPLLEAMYFEKPIICSNTTSLPEVGGDAALYFDPRRPEEIVAAMRSIMNDNELYSSLVLKGKARLATFRYDEMVNQYVTLFYKIAEENPSKEYYDVKGLYDDGWCGQTLSVIFGQSQLKRVINMELMMPDWHPSHNSIVKMLVNGKKGARVCLGRGDSIQIREILPEGEGVFQLEISNGFVPGKDDMRILTLLAHNLVIADMHSQEILYSHGS